MARKENIQVRPGELTADEKLILMADMIYTSAEEKVFYVNRKKMYLTPGTTEVDPKWAKVSMKVSTFYKKLAEIKEKTTERVFFIAKDYLPNMLDQYEKLQALEQGKLEVMEIVRSKQKYSEYNRIGDSVIAMQPYLSAWREAIKDEVEDMGGVVVSETADNSKSKKALTKASDSKRERVLAKTS